MIEKDIRQLFEEIDPEGKIPQGKMEELISAMQEMERNPLKDGDKVGDMTFNTLQEQMAKETDWRKRASIAAKIISANLE